MREFLFQQRAGQGFLFNIFHILLLSGVLVYAGGRYLLDQQNFVDQWVPFWVAVIFLAEVLQDFHRVLLRSWKRPKLTGKSMLVIALSFAFMVAPIIGSLTFFDPSQIFVTMAIVLASLAVVDRDLNAVAVSIANTFSALVKRRIYQQAQARILARKDLTVIGITGSFGKTSVKEFLSHLLEGKFAVLKTEKNTNTEIGIAQTILKKLKPQHQIFVCEMGAYQKGEIKLCCQIARPKIGIFTGLNEQHLALFGSLDQTFAAKWELISSLPADGLAVFNGDSPELRSRLQPYRGRSVVCSTQHGDVIAEEVEVQQESVSFICRGQKFVAPLIGQFQIINLLLCIAVAEHIGMTLPAIADRMKTLKPPEKTMELLPFKQGYILDDSYNVNPDGLRAALHHLEQFPDHAKVIFFPGVLELGEVSGPLHELMGEEVGAAVDMAFFTDPSFSEGLSRGAYRGGLTRNDVFHISDQDEMISQLQKLLDKEPQQKFIILFESRGSEKVLQSLRLV